MNQENKNYTDAELQEAINMNTTFEAVRRAMRRAGEEKRHLLGIAKSHVYMLKRYHQDNLVHRDVNCTLMISADKEALMALCKQEYGKDIVFDQNLQSNTVETTMGPASFKIEEIGLI